MHYQITKKIIAEKQSSRSGAINFLLVLIIALIAVPVAAIAFLSFLLFEVFVFLFSQITLLFTKQKVKPAAPDVPYHLELELLNNRHVKIMAVEDETDTELAKLNEVWSEEVGNAETYLYRAKTSPLIPALEGNIICFFLKEQPDGALLQVRDQTQNNPPLFTRLVFLQYDNLQVTCVDTIGPFYLYNDKKNNNLIQGFNIKQSLVLTVLNRDYTD